MSSTKKGKEELKWTLISIAVFCLGYVILEFVTTFNIPPGQTFYVVIGCLMMAAGLVKLYLIIKDRFFPKKKRKTKMVFMNEKQKKKTIEV